MVAHARLEEGRERRALAEGVAAADLGRRFEDRRGIGRVEVARVVLFESKLVRGGTTIAPQPRWCTTAGAAANLMESGSKFEFELKGKTRDARQVGRQVERDDSEVLSGWGANQARVKGEYIWWTVRMGVIVRRQEADRKYAVFLHTK